MYSLSCGDSTPAVSTYAYLTHGCSVRGVMDHESNKVFKVAITGDYNDLINKPTIPTIWSGTQAQYDLLTPDSNTIYIITSAS